MCLCINTTKSQLVWRGVCAQGQRERERLWLWCKQCTDKQHRSSERFFRIKNWDEEREEREKEID